MFSKLVEPLDSDDKCAANDKMVTPYLKDSPYNQPLYGQRSLTKMKSLQMQGKISNGSSSRDRIKVKSLQSYSTTL